MGLLFGNWLAYFSVAAVLIIAGAFVAHGGVGGPSGAPNPSPTPALGPSATQFRTPESPGAGPNPEAPSLAAAKAEDIISFAILTDKTEYYPQEVMNVTVIVNAARELPPCFITMEGITSSRGHRYVYESGLHSFAAGLNEYDYSFQLPACSPCSGLDYGEHAFSARVSCNGAVFANSTGSITLVKKE